MKDFLAFVFVVALVCVAGYFLWSPLCWAASGIWTVVCLPFKLFWSAWCSVWLGAIELYTCCLLFPFTVARLVVISLR